MYKSSVRHFAYHNIKGAWKGWTLDVVAMSRKDANQYIKNVHGYGKYLGENQKADCGAVTTQAQEHLRERLEIWLNETD